MIEGMSMQIKELGHPLKMNLKIPNRNWIIKTYSLTASNINSFGIPFQEF